ncbi:MAG: DUF5679 domain-containing protein [Anaerolineales bacterium]
MAEIKIHLPHCVIVRVSGLLPMLYKPAEIAEELGIPARTLYDWLKVGAPHQRDRSEHIWINGVQFFEWVNQNRKKKEKKRKLASDEAYCLRCKTAMHLINPVRQHVKGRLYLIKGICPQCGITINRGDSDDRTRQLSQNQAASPVSA